MSVLSDYDIQREVKNKNIFIEPFNKAQLSNSSYDVTLGPNYYRCNSEQELLLPWSQESVYEYWGQPQMADSIDTMEKSLLYHLPMNCKYILLKPNELILGHTNEYIGGLYNITTMMKARSSMGRIGISVCKDAGWGDVGFISRWTVEISNFSKTTIPLVVGSRIAQIVFFYTGEILNSYSKKGAYQKEFERPEDVLRSWTPNDMIPKFRF
jgi:dCTP deaminase